MQWGGGPSTVLSVDGPRWLSQPGSEESLAGVAVLASGTGRFGVVQPRCASRSCVSRGVLVLQISSRSPMWRAMRSRSDVCGGAAREPLRIGDAREALRRKECIHDGALSEWREVDAPDPVRPDCQSPEGPGGGCRAAARRGRMQGARSARKGRRRRIMPASGQSPSLRRSAGGVSATVLERAEGAGPQSERTGDTTVWGGDSNTCSCASSGTSFLNFWTRRVTLARFARRASSVLADSADDARVAASVRPGPPARKAPPLR